MIDEFCGLLGSGTYESLRVDLTHADLDGLLGQERSGAGEGTGPGRSASTVS